MRGAGLIYEMTALSDERVMNLNAMFTSFTSSCFEKVDVIPSHATCVIYILRMESSGHKTDRLLSIS